MCLTIIKTMRAFGLFRLIVFTGCVLLFVVIILGIPSDVGNAQTVGWSTPIRISEGEGFAYSPFVVSDTYGNLHIAWSENVADPANYDLTLDTIFYASYSQGGWSKPLDIFVAPIDGQARINRLRIDASNRLHLLYVTRPSIVYANVQVDQAENVRAWNTYEIAENAYIADLFVTPDETVHIVYVSDRQGIYYIQSADGGVTWSTARTVYFMPSDSFSSGSVRLEIGNQGTMHVAWSVSSGEARWMPVWISYARSTDGGNTWNSTLTVEEGDNYPNMIIDGEGNVHLLWDNLANTMTGRGHTLSMNDGVTWDKVHRIFPGLRGNTLWPVMGLDSAGTLYMVTGADSTLASGTRLFFSVWNGKDWEEPKIISQDIEGSEAPSLMVSEGNKINVVWCSYNPAQYGIWYTSYRTSAPAIEPSSGLSTHSQPVLTTPTAALTNEVKATDTTQATIDLDAGEVVQVGRRSTGWPIVIAGDMVIGLIAMVYFIKLFGSRR